MKEKLKLYIKNVLFVIFFILSCIVFIYNTVIAIVDGRDIRHYLDNVSSGMEVLGSGADIFLIILVFLSIVGSIFSALSVKFAQRRVVKIISAVLCILQFSPIVVGFFILMS